MCKGGNGVRTRQVFIPAALVIDSKPAYYAAHNKTLWQYQQIWTDTKRATADNEMETL